ncbi:MAG TPA: response regulator transcription factor [Solirubrobacteraceae bacterium]|nr:response regulator transcription factor [Solirubrobacteraceae bacterium]
MCDDEPQVLRALRVVLQEAGFDVACAETLAGARESVAQQPPDGAIVDLVLPDGSGIELCRELRSWSRMPILVLSGVDEEEQKVQALEAGADDYVTKPFSPGELVARLHAVFRRAEDGEEATILVRGLEVDLPAHSVSLDGRPLRLTPTEFNLLAMLVRNNGRLMTSQELLHEVWGDDHVRDVPLLRTHIANLRHKLERGRRGAEALIRTEPGVGYRFEG